jgi:hypothetical protein
MSLSITGDGLRPGDEFRFINKPANCASSTFAALTGDGLLVTRRATALFHLPDETPVLAHWHGQYRTDGFAMTIWHAEGEGGSVGIEASSTRPASDSAIALRRWRRTAASAVLNGAFDRLARGRRHSSCMQQTAWKARAQKRLCG